MNKNIGWLILIFGICLGVYALNIDVSVEYSHTSYATGKLESGRVNNIGLMDDKRNYLIVAGFLCVIGVVIITTASKTQTKEPTQAFEQKKENYESSPLAEKKETESLRTTSSEMTTGFKILLAILLVIICLVLINYDSLYNKLRSNPVESKIEPVESIEQKKYLLSWDYLVQIYSQIHRENGEILSILKEFNPKWNISTEGERSEKNFYFIYSLIDDIDLNKTGIINIDYKTNILEYSFFDEIHFERILNELIKNNFEHYSTKKIENGDVVSYISKKYFVSLKKETSTNTGTKSYSVYIMKNRNQEEF